MAAAKMLRMGLDQSMLDLHLRTQGTESLDVLVNGTTADITAAGKCHLRMLIFSQKSTDQIIGSSDLLDIFIFYYQFTDIGCVESHLMAIGALYDHTNVLHSAQKYVRVSYIRHIFYINSLIRHYGSSKNRKCRILSTSYFYFSD